MNPSNLFDKFSFLDILAYFLPGTAITLGLYFFLIQVEAIEISIIKPDMFTGILFFIVSFIIGIAFSGVSQLITWFFYWLLKKNKPEIDVPLNKESQDKIKQLIGSKLNIEIKNEWEEEYFVFCNIFINELLPISVSYSYRQKGLRLMRTYIMFPIVLWTINGIIYGINVLSISALTGWIWIVLSLFLGFLLLLNVWSRMYKNRQREMKNILASFICLDKILEINNIKKEHTLNK